MTEILTINCDNCNSDLTSTTNQIDYRLKLMDERIPSQNGMVTLMAMYPTLKDGSKHFCGLGCLKVWISKI